MELKYFEKTGKQGLEVQWEGPGLTKQTIAPDALSQEIFYKPINFGAKDSFTLETVVKTSAHGLRTLMSKNSDDDDSEHEAHGFWWALENGRQSFWVGSGEENQRVVSGVTVVNDGEWHHLAAVRDATSGILKVYVDFVLDGQSSDITSIKNLPIENQESLTIGIGDIQDFGSFESEAAFDLVRVSVGAREPNNFYASPEGEKRRHPSEILRCFSDPFTH